MTEQCTCLEVFGEDPTCPLHGGPLRLAVFETFGGRCDQFDAECETCQAWAGIDSVEALRAHPVRVKALEWIEATHIEQPTWYADSVGGKYEVGFDDGWWACRGEGLWEWEPENDPRSYSGPSAAMAAAQADYERRILSALEPTPPVITDEMVERAADAIGYNIAALVSGNNMPDMSGDPRRRIPAARRRHFDDACRSAARAAIRAAEQEIGE